jgi:hypothetical protein
VAEDVHRVYSPITPTRTNGGATACWTACSPRPKRGYVANHFGYDAGAVERLLGVLPWIYPGRTAELDFSSGG